MVEINNQRKAFLDMLAWSEELITDVKLKSWLWRHCRRAIYWLLRSPSQTCHARQNSNQQAPDATSFFPLVGCRKQLGLKDFSPKSQDAVALQQIKERGALLWLIVVISVRQSTVAAISGLHCRALVMVSSSIRLTAWLQNSRSGRNGQRDWCVGKNSPRLSPLWLSASSSACHGLLIITVITPLPTKPYDKNARELKLANAAITDMQMRQRDVAALDAKYTKELADAQSWKWCSAWWCCPLVVVGCTSKQSVSQCVKPPPPPAWIMQPPPTGEHRWTGLFHPQRLITMQKQLEGTQKYINRQCR